MIEADKCESASIAQARYTETLKRYSREGRGKGNGATYQPWLNARSFGSLGGSWRAFGKTGRVHQMVSFIEMGVFALLNRSPLVTDIREQFPLLSLKATQQIAHDLGYRHPQAVPTRDKGLPKIDVVMTTDFLVDLADMADLPAHIAISVKRATDLEDTTPRKLANLLKKAEIERRYWAAQRIPFILITERDLPGALLENVQFLHRYFDLLGVELPAPLNELADHLFDRMTAAPGLPVKMHCQEFDAAMGLARGTGINIAWHSIASGFWDVDLTEKIDAGLALHDLRRTTKGRAS